MEGRRALRGPREAGVPREQRRAIIQDHIALARTEASRAEWAGSPRAYVRTGAGGGSDSPEAGTTALDLFDLTNINVGEASEEEESDSEGGRGQNLDALPPSYSCAEGLDQLPSYTEAEVGGPYYSVPNCFTLKI